MQKAKHDSIFAVRFSIPLWLSVSAAAIAYVFCGFLMPPLMSGGRTLSRLTGWLIDGAPYLALALGAIGALALFRRLAARRFRKTQTEISALSVRWIARTSS